jgi:hypothetical protein
MLRVLVDSGVVHRWPKDDTTPVIDGRDGEQTVRGLRRDDIHDDGCKDMSVFLSASLNTYWSEIAENCGPGQASV